MGDLLPMALEGRDASQVSIERGLDAMAESRLPSRLRRVQRVVAELVEAVEDDDGTSLRSLDRPVQLTAIPRPVRLTREDIIADELRVEDLHNPFGGQASHVDVRVHRPLSRVEMRQCAPGEKAF